MYECEHTIAMYSFLFRLQEARVFLTFLLMEFVLPETIYVRYMVDQMPISHP